MSRYQIGFQLGFKTFTFVTLSVIKKQNRQILTVLLGGSQLKICLESERQITRYTKLVFTRVATCDVEANNIKGTNTNTCGEGIFDRVF